MWEELWASKGCPAPAKADCVLSPSLPTCSLPSSHMRTRRWLSPAGSPSMSWRSSFSCCPLQVCNYYSVLISESACLAIKSSNFINTRQTFRVCFYCMVASGSGYFRMFQSWTVWATSAMITKRHNFMERSQQSDGQKLSQSVRVRKVHFEGNALNLWACIKLGHVALVETIHCNTNWIKGQSQPIIFLRYGNYAKEKMPTQWKK